VPFLPDGRVVAVDDATLPPLPNDVVRGDEDVVVDTALRAGLQGAGFRNQRVHEFGRNGDDVLLWAEGDQYRGRREHRVVDWYVDTAEAVASWLAARGHGDDADVVRRAAASYRSQDDASYYADAARQLGASYLRAATPEGQSGFGGRPDEWRTARGAIADAIEHDGTFLDVGCANGLLMESVVQWCGERGVAVEPYGIDLVPELVELARRRLPRWRERLWPGNAVDWVHPEGRRFDSVRIGLAAVPDRHRNALVAHHLAHTVAPGGRLIVTHYVASGATQGLSVTDLLDDLGHPGAVATAPDVAWLSA
jgi:2-polyprenyl-3-methyl-5-hydroxy-6-metoxy-1,4-benzoquinol methylase